MKKKELQVISQLSSKDLLTKENPWNVIATRAADKNAVGFSIFDDKKLQTIADRMIEINRVTKAFGRKNTQTTNRFMTLTMLADDSPGRVIRQCLAQIENKRQAIKEDRFRMAKNEVKIRRLKVEIDKETHFFGLYKGQELDSFDKELKEIEIQKLMADSADVKLYLEGALKDLASFQSSYYQVVTKAIRDGKLPEKWDESDLEKLEVSFHVRMAMLNAFRDVMKGSGQGLGKGTTEYLQQFGIHPMQAYALVTSYVDDCQERMEKGEEVDFNDLANFLDTCEEEFKDNYLMVADRLGLSDIYEDWYMFIEESNKDDNKKWKL